MLEINNQEFEAVKLTDEQIKRLKEMEKSLNLGEGVYLLALKRKD